MDPGGVAAAVYGVGVYIGGSGSGKEILSLDVTVLVQKYERVQYKIMYPKSISAWFFLTESKGSSITDLTVLGRGGQGFCDDSTKALVNEHVTMGRGGVENSPNLCDVIFGRPLS